MPASKRFAEMPESSKPNAFTRNESLTRPRCAPSTKAAPLSPDAPYPKPSSLASALNTGMSDTLAAASTLKAFGESVAQSRVWVSSRTLTHRLHSRGEAPPPEAAPKRIRQDESRCLTHLKPLWLHRCNRLQPSYGGLCPARGTHHYFALLRPPHQLREVRLRFNHRCLDHGPILLLTYPS